jgi:hypothetical protein
VSIAQSHARGVQGRRSLILFQPMLGVEGFLLQVVHRRGRHHITIGYHECHKECVQKTLGILQFAVEAKLRRDRDFKGFEEKQKLEVT